MDSVGWLAYFMDDALADAYEPYLMSPEELLCSALSFYEVARRIEHSFGSKAASEAVAQMLLATVIPVDSVVATAAAELSIAHKLAMADAIIYATAQLHQATLVTSDAHFVGLPGVRYIPHPDARSV